MGGSMMCSFVTLLLLLFLESTSSFVTTWANPRSPMSPLESTSQTQTNAKESNVDIAQYLVDLHDSEATFNFCGGMMFQFVLSDKLRNYFLTEQPQVHVFDSSQSRMQQVPNYQHNADADNCRIFHGREIRQVANAAGGMGFVLQLSLAGADDPEGWTKAEIEGYDGWAHDAGRTWRKGTRLEEEGFSGFRERFSPSSFALHHRFFLHRDTSDRLWLSAEDGCEGTPSIADSLSPMSRLQSLFFG